MSLTDSESDRLLVIYSNLFGLNHNEMFIMNYEFYRGILRNPTGQINYRINLEISKVVDGDIHENTSKETIRFLRNNCDYH